MCSPEPRPSDRSSLSLPFLPALPPSITLLSRTSGCLPSEPSVPTDGEIQTSKCHLSVCVVSHYSAWAWQRQQIGSASMKSPLSLFLYGLLTLLTDTYIIQTGSFSWTNHELMNKQWVPWKYTRKYFCQSTAAAKSVKTTRWLTNDCSSKSLEHQKWSQSIIIC